MKKTAKHNKKSGSIFSCDSTASTTKKSGYKDPVLVAKKRERAETAKEKEKNKKQDKSEESLIVAKPSFGIRNVIKAHCYGNEPLRKCCGDKLFPYTMPENIPPKTKKYLKEREEAKKKYIDTLNFCQHMKDVASLPKSKKANVLQITLPSPEQSEAKVKPRQLSPTPSTIVPVKPNKKNLSLRKPKSGIIINEKEKIDEYDSFDLVYRREPRPGFEEEYKATKKKQRKRLLEAIREEKKELEEEIEKEILDYVTAGEESEIESSAEQEGDEEEKGEEEELIKDPGEERGVGEPIRVAREHFDKLSASTSYQTKDFSADSLEGPSSAAVDEQLQKSRSKSHQREDFSADSLNNNARVGEFTQKFRHSSDMERYELPHPKVTRGTFESHSFTRVYDESLREYVYGTITGTLHQDAGHFPQAIRNNQGIIMPVVAYCYALLKHPNNWVEKDIDNIIESGNEMFIEIFDKIGELGKTFKKLEPDDLPRYCFINDKKIRFNLSEPLITGYIESEEENVYNLSRGLRLFFAKNSAGILRTLGTNIAIWRDKYYFFFDAKPRRKDLYPSPVGNALMANFYDIDSVITVLMSRCMFRNWPFAIVAIEAFNVLNRTDAEDRESEMDIEDKTGFLVLNDRKAVLQGSFDLGDKCFGFTRNKQALPIAVMALVYSQISVPSSWYKKIVDKILIIGNQLYLVCFGKDAKDEMKLEDLPAEFTVGAYAVEMYVKPNVFCDFICRKGKCIMEKCLETFFEKHKLALVVLGNTTLSIWRQRGVFYCFDPYARGPEGYSARNGTACVSMHTDLDSLTAMVARNYCDKKTPFFIHALRVFRVLRERPADCSIPYLKSMNEQTIEDMKRSIKVKGKKPALNHTIMVQENAEKSLSAPPIELSSDESVIQVDSSVVSLPFSTIPKFPHGQHVSLARDGEKIVDLDSPSLSDTQVSPPEVPDENIGDTMVDISSYNLTMEELEGKTQGEGGGDDKKQGSKREDEKKGGASAVEVIDEANKGDEAKRESEEFYMAADAVTGIGSRSLLNVASVQLSAEISRFMIQPEVLHPTNLSKTLGRKTRVYYQNVGGDIVAGYEPEPDITQSEELKKENNFQNLPDNSQVVRAPNNMIDYVSPEGDLEFLAPFVAIMACTVAKKFSLISWSPDVVAYVMRCGQELYKASKIRYDEVSKLDIPKISLGSTDFHVIVDYVFDTYLKDTILELALDRILFPRSDCGIFVTPTYACAIFYRHHLYYLYDGYGNNEVGISEGPYNTGCACLVRFKDLRSLVQRIIFNKSIRDGVEPADYIRFVVSKVTVIPLSPPKPMTLGEDGTDDEDWTDVDDEAEGGGEEGEEEDKEALRIQPKLEIGWKWCHRVGTIRGTKSLKGRGVGKTEIKEDHFACLCACLMAIEVPIGKMDSAKVDFCLDQGQNIFNHADDLCATEKRIIKNILIRRHFFDVILKKITILNLAPQQNLNKNLSTGIDTLFGRRYNLFMVQTTGSCNVISRGPGKSFCVFDPYAIDKKGRPRKEGKAGWIRFSNLKRAKRKLKKEANKTGGTYSFYTFEVTSIKKAPKAVMISQHIHEYDMLRKQEKKEKIQKSFFEEVCWLNMSPTPWSRMIPHAPNGIPRGCSENMWYNWDIEYSGDLYSLIGNVHQASVLFPVETRGKQALCNLVMAIGMVHVYTLSAWNSHIIDSVLENGDLYCRDCIKDISEENYEIGVDDLKKNCEIFPYSFRIKILDVVDGAMFLVRSDSFNLYKALRYFFDDCNRRFGIITVTKTNGKRQVAFGKTRELEYFMFDCETVGAPMFADGKAVAYILRMTTLNRLLHVLTLTLRGGEFFIFEVQIRDFAPIS